MPYSKEKGTAYVWIPKTAGTSLANALKKRKVFKRTGQEHLWGRIPDESKEQFRAENWQHISAQDIIQIIGREEWDRCFTFTFLRNPYDRLVSFYEYSRSARKDPKSVQFGKPDPGSFEEWLDTTQPPGQLHYLTDENGEILVDFLGKYENLKRDLLTISWKIKVLPFRLPKLNTSARRDYRTYYTPDIKLKVEALYGEEIERFSYSF